jgi:hypothetical protein
MDDALNNPDRAWLARETNANIRQLAESLRDERPIGFFCECGCMGIVLVTLAEYDLAGGVWLDGHRPPETPAVRTAT